ncbi:MAG: deoxyguanosinetriphosphate triphosphohydrolase [Oscillospiraceae bacterium]|jgi:dGTPase|nr:deoxyguanosinetriphosphate triphosphohydrolase [Oscillospiraceae bacterium]
MSIREEIERREREYLSGRAAFSDSTRGRAIKSAPCDIRTEYQRDRDRVIHSKAFRRLMNKTQVFLSPEGDHYRTRLTHTLEVCQIARTVARALSLNEDLTEAIALGHDLGHTPFGHAGESVLNEVCPHGFVHAEQSVRVVEALENGGRGLNLTFEVRDGIRRHSSGQEAETLEGRVVRYADKIAYMSHDIDDAIRAGVLTREDIPPHLRKRLGDTKSRRITAFVDALIENSGENIGLGPCLSLYEELRSFLFEAVYFNPAAKKEEGKAREMVRYLYLHFTKKPEGLPPEYQKIAGEADVPRAVCDYISGMSDRYCVAVFEGLFIPRSWA